MGGRGSKLSSEAVSLGGSSSPGPGSSAPSIGKANGQKTNSKVSAAQSVGSSDNSNPQQPVSQVDRQSTERSQALRTPLNRYQSIYTDKPEYMEYRMENETRFVDKLTAGEKGSLSAYKGSGYKGINAELRGQYSPTAKNQAHVKRIDSALKKSTLGRDLVLYRGFSSSDKHEVGKVYSDAGFMSTSLNPNKAFSGHHFIKIHAKSTVRGAFIESQRIYNKAATPGSLNGMLEHEVLLARGTKYVVVGKSKVKTMYGEREAVDVVILP